MKHDSVFYKIIPMGILCFFLWCGVGCNTNIGIPEPEDSEDENPIVNIWGIHFAPGGGKQHYKAGETFHTTGDRLHVQFADGTRSHISSGFTQEWSDGRDDDSVWAPIKHGDPLPMSPSGPNPKYFYVRADLMGMKSTTGQRTVSSEMKDEVVSFYDDVR